MTARRSLIGYALALHWEIIMSEKAKLFLVGIMTFMGISFGSAADAQEFYKDKIITFIVGYSPGGTYDQYTRLIARHIGKYIPGNPTTVVENMPGAGGIIAANHLYNRVKPDGLTVAAWAAPLILQQIMGNEAAKFDARKVGWVGIPGPYDTACHFSRESGIKTIDDWFAAKRPVKIASIGPGTSLSDVPKLLKAALGLPLDVVEGYKGGPKRGWRWKPVKSTAFAAHGKRPRFHGAARWSRVRFVSCSKPL